MACVFGQLPAAFAADWAEQGADVVAPCEIADWDMPVAAAIDLVDQWVAFFGFSSSV
ncbi:hypothetical protein SUDANB1_00118 [Streptomyces sp. enrichment culture]